VAVYEAFGLNKLELKDELRAQKGLWSDFFFCFTKES